MKNIIQKIYSLVIEELITEGVKDDLITYFGGTDEVKELVTAYWNDFRHRLRGTPEADANYWKKNNKTFEEFKEVMRPFLEKIEKRTDFSKMSLYDYWDVIPDSELYSYKNIPAEIQSKMKYDKVFEDNKWLVVVPKDMETSMIFSKLKKGALGTGSEDVGHCTWCTGTHNLKKQYFNAYAHDGPQYIIINKKTETKWNIQIYGEWSFDNKQDQANEHIDDYDVFPPNILNILLDRTPDEKNIINFMITLLVKTYKHIYDIDEKYRKLINLDSAEAVYKMFVRSGDIQKIKYGLQFVDARDNDSEALRWAAERSNSEVVKLLIPYSDCKARDSYALRVAIAYNMTENAILLIPFSDCKANDSAALIGAVNNNNKVLVEMLIPHSDCAAQDSMALKIAVRKNNIEIIKLLIPHSDPEVVKELGLDK